MVTRTRLEASQDLVKAICCHNNGWKFSWGHLHKKNYPVVFMSPNMERQTHSVAHQAATPSPAVLTPCCLLSKHVFLLYTSYFVHSPAWIWEMCPGSWIDQYPALYSSHNTEVEKKSMFQSSFVISQHYHYFFILVWWKKSLLNKFPLLFDRNKLVTEYINSRLSFVHVRDDLQIYNSGTNCPWTTPGINTLFLDMLLTRLRKTPRGKWCRITW